MSNSVRRVLFVCTGNTCRSPMAAALARRLLDRKALIESAGIDADSGSAATKDAVTIMNEWGLDISRHKARSLDGLNLLDFDLLIALTVPIAETLRLQGIDESKIRAIDIEDPYGRGLEAYKRAALNIERELGQLFSKLHQRAARRNLVSYLSDALSRTEAGNVSSPSGSWLAGIFGKAANWFEKEFGSYVYDLLITCNLRYPNEFRKVLRGAPPYERLTLGQLIAVSHRVAELKPEVIAERFPNGSNFPSVVEEVDKINHAWVDTKHGLELSDTVLLAHMRTMLTLAQLLKQLRHQTTRDVATNFASES